MASWRAVSIMVWRNGSKDTDFTVEAFVKVAERSGYAAIAADWSEDGENRSWAFVLTPRGGLRFDVSPDGSFHGGNKLETAARLIEPGRWYHVAAVSQGTPVGSLSTADQVAEASRAVPGIFSNDRANLKIGNVDHFATTGPRPWHGSLDEVRITLKSLAPADFIRTREAMPTVARPGARTLCHALHGDQSEGRHRLAATGKAAVDGIG